MVEDVPINKLRMKILKAILLIPFGAMAVVFILVLILIDLLTNKKQNESTKKVI